MHRHHEDITKVDLIFTDPSQVIASTRRACAIGASTSTSRGRGQVYFDLSCVLIVEGILWVARTTSHLS